MRSKPFTAGCRRRKPACYENIIKFKISGKIDYLTDSSENDKNRIYADLLKLTDTEKIIDAGAYDGDTIREFTAFTNGKYQQHNRAGAG